LREELALELNPDKTLMTAVGLLCPVNSYAECSE
jgi:hypothetical protein